MMELRRKQSTKMTKGQTLRALVTERLTVAAEEIFAVLEKTIAEYEEELCRCKQENQQLQSSRALLHTERDQASTSSPPEPCPNITESQIKEEPKESSVKQEELLEFNTVNVKSEENQQLQRIALQHIEEASAQPPPCPSQNREIIERQIKEEPEDEQRSKQEEDLVSVPECNMVCMKTGETLHFLQGQTENRVETKVEDFSSGPHFHSETERDTDNDWDPRSDEDMETELDRHRIQIRDNKSPKMDPQNKFGPKRIVKYINNEDMSGTDGGTEKNKPQCSVYQPYSCPIYQKTFAKKTVLRRVHTAEKAHSCSDCVKGYSFMDLFRADMRAHARERLHSCMLCEKSFDRKSLLDKHMRSHTRERPYSCLFCGKAFCANSSLTRHLKTHSEGKQCAEFD